MYLINMLYTYIPASLSKNCGSCPYKCNEESTTMQDTKFSPICPGLQSLNCDFDHKVATSSVHDEGFEPNVLHSTPYKTL